MKKRTVVFFFLLAVPWFPLFAQQRAPLWVGILSNGNLVPFGMLHQNKWSSPWPEPADGIGEEGTNAPKSVPPKWTAGRPLPRRWHAWMMDGTQRDFTIGLPKGIIAGCVGQWALATQPPALDAEFPYTDEPPYRAPSFAMTQRLTIRRFQTTDAAKLASARTIALIRPGFDRLESLEIEKARGEGMDVSRERLARGHPLAADVRRSGSIVTELLVGSGPDSRGFHYFYVEAVREYVKPRTSQDYDCKPLSFYQLWVSQDSHGAPSILDERLTLSDCDRVDVTGFRPVALVAAPGRIFFVAEKVYYEAVDYAILEVKNGRMRERLAVSGGGC